MSLRDQSFNIRARVLPRHHHLGVEQTTRIPGSPPFRFELGYASACRGEFVGIRRRRALIASLGACGKT
jgi:hypothetical protein